MMQFDLFSDLTLKQETKKEEKKETKTTEKKASATKPVFKYRYPVQIYTGFKEIVLEGIGEVEEDKVKEAAAEILNCPVSMVEIVNKTMGGKKDTGSTLEVYVTSYSKTKPDSLDGWDIRYREFTMPGAGTVDDSVKAFAKQYPVFEGSTLICDKKAKVAYVCPQQEDLEDVELPFRYCFFGGQIKEYSGEQEEEKPFNTEEVVVDDGGDDADADDGKVSVAEILIDLEKEYKVKLIARKDGDHYVIFPTSRGTLKAAAPKVTLYSVENTQLSLLLRHIPLSPDMFGGKKEVTEDDLFSWLTPQHPEVSKTTASFFWDEKNRLIVCRLQGASKGADIPEFTSESDYMNYLKDREYGLCRYTDEDGTRFRVEKTPVGRFKVEEGRAFGYHEESDFRYFLPKVPASIWTKILAFFKEMAKIPVEAAVNLFYDPETKKFIFFIPQQTVSFARCDITYSNRWYELASKYLFVAEIHSHHLMRAQFSAIDDNDELGTRVYGVWGSYMPATEFRDEFSIFNFRAGSGGGFARIRTVDFLDDYYGKHEPVSEEEVKAMMKPVVVLQDSYDKERAVV